MLLLIISEGINLFQTQTHTVLTGEAITSKRPEIVTLNNNIAVKIGSMRQSRIYSFELIDRRLIENPALILDYYVHSMSKLVLFLLPTPPSPTPNKLKKGSPK